MIIGLTGLPGSGKSTAAQILQGMGFEISELSSTIKEMMAEKKMEITPSSIIEFSLLMKREFGADVFAKIKAKQLKGHLGNIAIVGFRSNGEVNAIRSELDSKLIMVAIVAGDEMRYGRLHDRKEFNVKNREDFKLRDEKNILMGIKETIDSADYIISNSGTLEELKSSIEQVIEGIQEKAKG